MSQSIFHTNPNKLSLSSIDAFCNINGRYKDYSKDCFFLRYIGLKDASSYLQKIQDLDRILKQRSCGYYRVTGLSNYIPDQELLIYQRLYDALTPDASHTGCHFQFQDPVFEQNLVQALYKIFALYRQEKAGCSDSILRNFGIKMLYWIDQYLPSLYTSDYNMSYSPKFLFSGNCGLQEYLFLYYLVLTGCDVLYLNSEGDLALSNHLMGLSQVITDIHREAVVLPPYPQKEAEPVQNTSVSAGPVTTSPVTSSPVTSSPVSIAHPKRPVPGTRPVAPVTRPVAPSSPVSSGTRPAASVTRPVAPSRSRVTVSPTSPVPSIPAHASSREPLSYEELASFATSVVMIGVFDGDGKCYKTGSGVMIAEGGYLVTNFHVVRGGAFYSIRIEDEEHTYETDELIKYHPDFDLAILRIDRTCRPIPLYRGEPELARGQKVVAIGSPLGLFNSVSDGIISGFREIDDTPMIQFTAATSHGSSGGALLNMQGELIGLCTAGFDDGQNLNLAVDYKILNMFLKGFLH